MTQRGTTLWADHFNLFKEMLGKARRVKKDGFRHEPTFYLLAVEEHPHFVTEWQGDELLSYPVPKIKALIYNDYIETVSWNTVQLAADGRTFINPKAGRLFLDEFKEAEYD